MGTLKIANCRVNYCPQSRGDKCRKGLTHNNRPMIGRVGQYCHCKPLICDSTIPVISYVSAYPVALIIMIVISKVLIQVIGSIV